MKTLFMGQGAVAVPALSAALESGQTTDVEVITKAVGRGGDESIAQLAKEKADRLDLLLKGGESLAEILRDRDFDAALVVSFGEILSEALIDKYRGKLFNVHFSLLPAWRGAAPVQAGILAGEENFGISIQQMQHRVDAGALVAQKSFNLPGLPASEVLKVLTQESGAMVTAFLNNLAAGDLQPRPQDESLVTRASKIEKADGKLSLSMPVTEAWRKYLAFDMWPGVSIKAKSGDKIYDLKILEMSQQKINETDYCLNFEGGDLWVQRVQFPGKTPTLVERIRNGYPNLEFLG